ncbi:hypothetical protein DSCOOX_19230 [Desulfosarcina ovata subsp. ovata]|uniref:Uncharacterized protein n=1 Tax=Desulfosarcina ovata subsp. ovata TaxID=2752305 RepID=A0A5K8A7W8_9BACT|nr:hypothetical protein DSCOOX_19230 [Desulfosarcina ovata subsp. ovata]
MLTAHNCGFRPSWVEGQYRFHVVVEGEIGRVGRRLVEVVPGPVTPGGFGDAYADSAQGIVRKDIFVKAAKLQIEVIEAANVYHFRPRRTRKVYVGSTAGFSREASINSLITHLSLEIALADTKPVFIIDYMDPFEFYLDVGNGGHRRFADSAGL